ncbi:hypothetical protein KCU85_g7384, partial [Aureobasidium melanogenum]
MSTPESTILGLRTQIFGHTNVVILTTRERERRSVNMYRFEAITADDISMGTRVFVKASSLGSHEAALRLLLDITSDMMKEVLEGQSAELLDVKHLSPDTSIAQNNTTKPVQNTSRPVQNISKPVQDTNKPVKSPEEVEMLRFHKALGRVLDLASSKSESSSFASKFRIGRR